MWWLSSSPQRSAATADPQLRYNMYVCHKAHGERGTTQVSVHCDVCVYYCSTYYKAVRVGGGNNDPSCLCHRHEFRTIRKSYLIIYHHERP